MHYLDDKPVFEDERRFAEAFGRGGLEAEKKERALYKKEKEEYELNRLKEFQNLIDNWKKEKQMDGNENALGNGERNEQEGKEQAAGESGKDEEQRRQEREEAKKKLLLKCKEKQQLKKNSNANVSKNKENQRKNID